VPSLSFELVKAAPFDAELVVEGVAAGSLVPDDPVLKANGFEAKQGQTAVLPGRLLVGLGEVGDDGPSDDVLRSAAASAARAASRCRVIATTLPASQAVAEGFALGAYRYAKYKSEPGPGGLQQVHVIGSGGARARSALERGARVAEAVAVARDLVNEPGGELTAPELADRAVALGEANGFTVKVLDEKAIAKAKLAGLIAVNRGSDVPPRFVELTFKPGGRPTGTVALVGKGITFDSGGLSLKPADGMITMKDDMGGAAAVLAAVSACRDLGVKVRVRGFMPLTDNMPGGDAMRVGDIIRYRNGRTVEVLNTDAEGRLVLADALIVASQEKPDAIVDLATLTGAQQVALGSRVAARFAGHAGWGDQVQAAADAAGEPLWPLPLVETYRRDLDSKIADLRNVASHRHAGAITAALFLREFVGEGIPWVHLDIAGPAFSDTADGEIGEGGTGYGVRTLLQLLSSYRRP
jgi:leucyl aminopeptidase